VRRWWGRCGLAGLFFVLLLARSGGGLGPSSLCGQLNDLFVLGTFVCALAAGVFFVIALGSTVGSLLAAVSGVLPKGAVAVTEPAPPPLYSTPPTPVGDAMAQRSPLWRWLQAAAVVVAAWFILAVPSGCVPFRVCGQGAEVARAAGPSVRFVGNAPAHGPSGDAGAAITATFDAKAPWVMRWSSTADRVRIDAFTADAMQTGRYFPDHPSYADGGPNGSTTVNASGSFCVRVELRDLGFEAALNAYYSESRHTGPPPSSRPMSWEVTIAPP
jgi:hypothetical protein